MKSVSMLSSWKLVSLVGAFACTVLVACGDDDSDVFLTRPDAGSSKISSSSARSSSSSDRYSSSERSSSSVSPKSSSSETSVSSSARSSSSSYASSSSSSSIRSSSSSYASSSSYSSSISVAYAEPCRDENFDDCEYGTLIDERDGQSYKTVKIGDQWWMAENLNFAYLQPTKTLDSSSFCYDDDALNCEKYGRLYLWSAAMDSAAIYSDDGIGCGYEHDCSPAERVQGVCPQGWHVPTRGEFYVLYQSVGGTVDSVVAKKKLMAVDEWRNCGAGCTDSYGFTVLPVGYFDEKYEDLGTNALFWSSTPYYLGSSTNSAYYMYVNFYMGFGSDDEDKANTAKSVRCIKDKD